MGGFADRLLGGPAVEDEAALIQAQQRRPAPVEQDPLRGGGRPRVVPSPAPQAQPPVAAPPQPSFSERLLGGTPKAVPSAVTPATQPADDRSLYRKTVDAIAGQRDPAHANLRSLEDELLAEKSYDVTRQMALGGLMNASDEAYHDIAKDALGRRYVRTEKDSRGYDIITYRDKSGAERKAYVNAPGLDVNDIGRTATGMLPFVIGGGLIGGAVKGLPLGARMAGQFVGGGSTSVGTDLGAQALGSKQGVELGKAAVIGGLGAAGEAVAVPIAFLWRKFMTVPGLYDRAAGQLTDKGVAAARQAAEAAKIDPEKFLGGLEGRIAEEFAKVYSQSPKEAAAGVKAVTDRFGFKSTLGSRTKDVEQLLKEKGMEAGLYGQNAKQAIVGLKRENAEAIERATITGTAKDPIPSIASKIAPNRAPGDIEPALLGESIRGAGVAARDASKAEIKEAWKKVSDMNATPEALATLPEAIAGRVGGMASTIDPVGTPAAHRMEGILTDYMMGVAPKLREGVLRSASVDATIIGMQRRLLAETRKAANPTDRELATAFYKGFDDWVAASADRGLISAAPDAVAAWRSARSITRELKELFAPTDKSGALTAGGKRLNDILEKADNPEAIVGSLFFNAPQPSQIKSGSVQALEKLKEIATRFGHVPEVQSLWNDIGVAYWARLVMDRRGRMYEPGKMLANIEAAVHNQRSVINLLYTREQQQEIGAIGLALEQISFKDPNTSGSGIAAASYAKQFFGKILDSVGLKTGIARTALEQSGIGRSFGTVAAKRAVDQSVQPNSSRVGRVVAGPAAAAFREQK